MNLTTNKQSSKKLGFSKHIIAKTHNWKNSSLQKTSIQIESLSQTQCSC
jgi:hypothetical protein